jgi:ATP-dependent protease ClpP protease subunit
MWTLGNRSSPDPHDSEEALRHRIVRLDGEITDATAQVAIAQMLFLQHEDDQQPLTLRIASPGGSRAAGMAVVDTVRELRPPVRTRAPEWAPRHRGRPARQRPQGRTGSWPGCRPVAHPD